MNIVIPKSCKSLEELQVSKKILKPFSLDVIAFISDISSMILKDSVFKQYPELIALAFWMRKSHLFSLKKEFESENKDKVLFARGVAFHIAPSNVDTIFIYSMFISMLVGNSNIVRISSKENIQVELLLDVLKRSMSKNEHKSLEKKMVLVKYGHDDELTKHFSALADIRVIWGGDATINHIRSIPIPPTATEMTFADKFSFAMIKSDTFLKEENIDTLVTHFYNDSYWFSQMACSSIRMVVWVGSKKNNLKAQEHFWKVLDKYVQNNIPDEIVAADVMNKKIAECSIALDSEQIKVKEMHNPYINVVTIDDIELIQKDFHCGVGLFYELCVESVNDILPRLDRKTQSIAQFGFDKDEIVEALYHAMPLGIDRIVNIGHSLEFSHIWDGFNLFRNFTRQIEIE